MTARKRQYTVRLTHAAQRDFRDILQWTREKFGELQVVSYEQTLQEALDALRNGPSTIGAKHRKDIFSGLFLLRVSRAGHKGRQVIAFIADAGTSYVDVIRILHDSMDIERHLPAEE